MSILIAMIFNLYPQKREIRGSSNNFDRMKKYCSHKFLRLIRVAEQEKTGMMNLITVDLCKSNPYL